MTTPPDGRVDVLAGTAEPDLDWVVRASGTDEMFMTMLYVSRAGVQLAGSGMGGPKLYAGDIINEYRGKSDDLPYFVMVRAAVDVDRVVATTEQGTQVVLALSPINTQFGLRFGAAALPIGETPGTIRAEIAGDVAQIKSQRMPPRPSRRPDTGTGQTSGWIDSSD